MTDSANHPPFGARLADFLRRERTLACTLGAVMAAIVDIVASTITTPFPSAEARALHLLWDFALLVGLGVVSDASVLTLERTIGARSIKLFWAAVFVLAAGVMHWTLERIFSRQADSILGGWAPSLFYALFVIGAGLGLTLCLAFGRWLASRGRWFVAAPIASLLALITNVISFPDDYIEIHSAVVWCAATFGGAGLSRRFHERIIQHKGRSRSIVFGVVAAATMVSLVPPPNSARIALLRSPGGVGAWVFANVVWGLPTFDGPPAESIDPRWYSARQGAPPRPPSPQRIARGAPVVVLLTIDAVRVDAVLDPKNATKFPTLARMMREGATFTQARSPGSQTAVSMTALFAGKYFSEMRWEKYGTGRSRFEYAAVDETPRFVAALSDSGVSTFKVASLTFLKNEFGAAGGFSEEKVVTTGRRHARAKEVVGPLVARLASVKDDEAFFGFAHLTEPHAPYDRGKLGLSQKDQYLSEIAVADAYVARVLEALSARGLAERSLLVVTSDHGEAFGEHGTHFHTKTIYEELLRVPLLVWGKHVEARTIDEPVSLIDLGPTILDIFGVDTPDWHAGQTLVPTLAGRPANLTRPLFAEGRLRRAMYVDDLKVIVDLRRKTIEAYDLRRDPGELVNLYDEDRERTLPALAALDAYFQGRAFTDDGYRPVYKP